MAISLESILDRYFVWAIKEQAKLYDCEDSIRRHKADIQAIDAACNLANQNRFLITKNWLRAYGVFQGITDDQRDAIVNAIHCFYDLNHAVSEVMDTDLQISRALELFTQLSGYLALIDGNKRRLISLTSKALWCRFPDLIPMYDQYALAATIYIHKLELDEPFDHSKILTPRNKTKREKDIMDYEVYLRNYLPMYAKFKTRIISKLIDENVDYRYPIRIFDKSLWAFGSPSQEIKYRQEVYERG